MKQQFELIYSIDDIHQNATDLLAFFNTQRIICFEGNLGSGKTTFISALCSVLGSKDIISSPTFSLVNEYESDQGVIYHFDLYRLKNSEEALDIGFEEYINSNNYCFIEWPQKITNFLPPNLVLNCKLSYISLLERKIVAWTN